MFCNISVHVLKQTVSHYKKINSESYLYQKECIKSMNVFMTAGYCQFLLLLAVGND